MKRHPKRGGKDPRTPEVHSLSGFVLGYCASDLINTALNLVVEFEERRSGTPPPTVS